MPSNTISILAASAAVGIFMALGSSIAYGASVSDTTAQDGKTTAESSFQATFGSTIQLLDSDTEGRYTLNASINGVRVTTYYTAESWFATLSTTTYLFLYENGYIAPADVKGFSQLKFPDGSSEKAASFIIRELRIDDVVMKDVPAFVVKSQTVPFLIGNSTFDGIGGAVQHGNKLVIGGSEAQEPQMEAEAMSPEDSLKEAAQRHLDAKEYAEAASCFEALGKDGALNMFTHYEYAIVLDLLGMDDKNISVSTKWLNEYAGKSLTMDYWIYNGLGNAYSRKKDNGAAIDAYKKSIEAYCQLFNTSEKAIRKSSFKDETLGMTMFNLSRIYANEGNVSKAEYYCSLAAKSGSQQAIDFCNKYKIKY